LREALAARIAAGGLAVVEQLVFEQAALLALEEALRS